MRPSSGPSVTSSRLAPVRSDVLRDCRRRATSTTMRAPSAPTTAARARHDPRSGSADDERPPSGGAAAKVSGWDGLGSR